MTTRTRRATREMNREQDRRQLHTALSTVADLLEGIADEIADGRFTESLDTEERDRYRRSILMSSDSLRFDLPGLLPNVLDDIPDCLTKLSSLLELDEGGA